jgi:serine/tyrosine/threonine adenylyltransferase
MIQFQNSFAALPSSFYTKQLAQPMAQASLVAVSPTAAQLLDIEAATIMQSSAWQAMLSGGTPLPGADPLAAVYAGHQFGQWAGQLGDGRALLLGEVRTCHGPMELQLKGSGPTPYSRRADGYAVLRSSIRELLCSEAMAGLGIPTTRALSMTVSDRPVIRETYETSAIVCRMAPSFIRFGSFEYFCHFNKHDDLKTLADYTIDRFYPEARMAIEPHRIYSEFLKLVTEKTAMMVAHWQSVGFCHGVMNTDNMSILGLTLDYGPFGFLDAFDEEHICNHSDDLGRYSFANQPRVAHWNCYCLAQALMPLIKDVASAEAALAAFNPKFEATYLALMRNKLGFTEPHVEDAIFIQATLALLQANKADFTLFFRRLATINVDNGCRDLMLDWASFEIWKAQYQARLSTENVSSESRRSTMQAANPAYVLRNHLAEQAIQKARGDHGSIDYSEIDRLMQALTTPFAEQDEFADYAALPPSWANDLSVSCSS